MHNRNSESGNVIFFILLGIVLIALVTAAIRSGGDHGANIDRETLLLNVTQVREYASELERAVVFIMHDGFSEVDIRFAHPDSASIPDYGDLAADATPENQVFHRNGGAARYRIPPPGILFVSGGLWEFYGYTRMPHVGTDRADLIAVLPNVTQAFCDEINRINGQTSVPQETGADCIHDITKRFGLANPIFDDTTTNELDYTSSSFTTMPAMQACVLCVPGPPAELHFYHVLHAR